LCADSLSSHSEQGAPPLSLLSLLMDEPLEGHNWRLSFSTCTKLPITHFSLNWPACTLWFGKYSILSPPYQARRLCRDVS
jgi:hypothetical protein